MPAPVLILRTRVSAECCFRREVRTGRPGDSCSRGRGVTLATALVWGPLILFLLLGNRVIARMEGAQAEVGRRQPQVTVYAFLILAALLVLDAVSALLT
jgi:hypothetical protein